MKGKRIIEELAQNANQVFSEIKDGVLVKVDPRDVKDWQYTTPPEVTKIGFRAFENCVLTAVTIGDNVTEIGGSAFQGQELLQIVKMGKNVTKLGGYAFQGCFSLMVANLSNGIKEIPEGAFYDCGNLYDVTLPKSLEKIAKYAFCDCVKLRSITPPPTTLKEVSNMAFGGVPVGRKFMDVFNKNRQTQSQGNGQTK